MTCGPCNHACDQGRSCPARIAQAAARSLHDSFAVLRNEPPPEVLERYQVLVIKADLLLTLAVHRLLRLFSLRAKDHA